MIKTRFLIITLILLSLTIVTAQADIDKAYIWLTSQKSQDGSWDSKIIETSASILALTTANLASEAQISIDWLLTQKDQEGCFPVNNCKVKDTAFALLALDKAGKTTQDTLDWLKSAQKTAPSSGKWWLQVVTDSDGTCELSYTDPNDQQIIQTIQITDKKFPQCRNNNWFDLRECVTGKPLNKQPTVEFNIDCDNLPTAIISLIYQSADNYYLLEESRSISTIITPDTGCWAEAKTGTCKTDPTLYASWAIKEADGSTPAITWLRDNYKRSDTNHNSLLLLITGKSTYLTELESLQQSTGSWGNSVFRTSLATLSIISTDPLSEKLTSAIDWLTSKQETDGSWGNNVLDTSITLYSAYSGFTPTCGDGLCKTEDNETQATCPADCAPSFTTTPTEDTEICNDNLDNDNDGFTDCEDIDCISDSACFIDAEICDDLIDNDNDGFTDCEDIDCSTSPLCTPADVTIEEPEEEKGTSVLFWIILIIILLLIAGLIFFLYKKGYFKRKKKAKPKSILPFTLPRRPTAPLKPTTRQLIRRPTKKKPKEDELEKSIKEARKLMGLK